MALSPMACNIFMTFVETDINHKTFYSLRQLTAYRIQGLDETIGLVNNFMQLNWLHSLAMPLTKTTIFKSLSPETR